MNKVPFYSTPALHVDDTGSDTGRIDVQPTGLITVTLGSDLVMWAERKVEYIDHEHEGTWRIGVCDSDANHLAILAVVKGSLKDLRAALPIAERTAVRLFPNHLLLEV